MTSEQKLPDSIPERSYKNITNEIPSSSFTSDLNLLHRLLLNSPSHEHSIKAFPRASPGGFNQNQSEKRVNFSNEHSEFVEEPGTTGSTAEYKRQQYRAKSSGYGTGSSHGSQETSKYVDLEDDVFNEDIYTAPVSVVIPNFSTLLPKGGSASSSGSSSTGSTILNSGKTYEGGPALPRFSLLEPRTPESPIMMQFPIKTAPPTLNESTRPIYENQYVSGLSQEVSFELPDTIPNMYFSAEGAQLGTVRESNPSSVLCTNDFEIPLTSTGSIKISRDSYSTSSSSSSVGANADALHMGTSIRASLDSYSSLNSMYFSNDYSPKSEEQLQKLFEYYKKPVIKQRYQQILEEDPRTEDYSELFDTIQQLLQEPHSISPAASLPGKKSNEKLLVLCHIGYE